MEQWVNVQPAMFEDILDDELSKFDRFRTQLEDTEKKQRELLEAVKVRCFPLGLCLLWVGLSTYFTDDASLRGNPTPQERHAAFAQLRKEDDDSKAREHALQSLDLAYHKYKEILQNLEEGQKASQMWPICLTSLIRGRRQFYNDLAVILSQFRDMCKEWVDMRRQEMRYVTTTTAL